MTIAETLLTEFEQEASTTRKFLERLPEDKLSWKPHEKSMTAGQLALHIAIVPANVLQFAKEDEMAIPDDFNQQRPQPTNMAEVMKALDDCLATVRQELPMLNDQRMHAIWRMTKDGKELLAMPRAAFLRSIMLNHWYHHRGQFGVYLRLMGCKVPSSYGPSGDEAPDFLNGK